SFLMMPPVEKRFHTFLRRHHSPRMYALPRAVGVPMCLRALLALAMIKARMVRAYGVIISKQVGTVTPIAWRRSGGACPPPKKKAPKAVRTGFQPPKTTIARAIQPRPAVILST